MAELDVDDDVTPSNLEQVTCLLDGRSFILLSNFRAHVRDVHKLTKASEIASVDWRPLIAKFEFTGDDGDIEVRVEVPQFIVKNPFGAEEAKLKELKDSLETAKAGDEADPGKEQRVARIAKRVAEAQAALDDAWAAWEAEKEVDGAGDPTAHNDQLNYPRLGPHDECGECKANFNPGALPLHPNCHCYPSQRWASYIEALEPLEDVSNEDWKLYTTYLKRVAHTHEDYMSKVKT